MNTQDTVIAIANGRLMTRTRRVAILLLLMRVTPAICVTNDVFAEEFGQLKSPPTLFKAGVDDEGREFFLNGQSAADGRLIFTASNGFFDPGTCRAAGESTLPKVGDEKLIAPNFAYLDGWKKTEHPIRWHVWLPKSGKVRFNVKLTVAADAAGSRLRVSFAGQSRIVKTVASPDATTRQPWDLEFNAAKSGEHAFTVSAEKIANPKTGVGQLHTVLAEGPAIRNAQVLRARWRPAAAHGSYASSACPESRLWVMTTRSHCDATSYSPITTPFGYFGTTFNADGTSGDSFNFSMWASGRQAAVPPIEKMPHLLAAGSSEAEFSGFGHEGSGVKIRGWTAMPDHPKTVVQALRVENDGNYNTYYGYFWNDPTKHWKLFAVGRKWSGGKRKTHLRPGSFCEVPGPPHTQRTGDVVREVRRRGWFRSKSGQWHQMDTFVCRSKDTTNKFWYTTEAGEFAMGTGGMRHYEFKQPARPQIDVRLPEFLNQEATAQLQILPAKFGAVIPMKTSSKSVTLDISMIEAGSNARAEIHYGETDCLTFAKRTLHATERASAVSKSTQQDGRAWSHQVDIPLLKNGSRQVGLSNLKPNTVYFYRVLVINDAGKIWTFDTHSFVTSGG